MSDTRNEKLNLSEYTPEEIARRVLTTPPPPDKRRRGKSAATEAQEEQDRQVEEGVETPG